jgi:hypothetical protein
MSDPSSHKPLSPWIWLIAVVWSGVFLSMTYIAIVDQQITISGRSGRSTVTGVTNLVVSLLSFSFAAGIWAFLAQFTRYARRIQLTALAVWLSGLLAYGLFHGPLK